MLHKLAQHLPRRRAVTPAGNRHPRESQGRTKASGLASADVDSLSVLAGAGGGWNRAEYGEYYATSTPVYAAIKVRSDALTRPQVVVYRHTRSQTVMPKKTGIHGPELPGARNRNAWFDRLFRKATLEQRRRGR